MIILKKIRAYIQLFDVYNIGISLVHRRQKQGEAYLTKKDIERKSFFPHPTFKDMRKLRCDDVDVSGSV